MTPLIERVQEFRCALRRLRSGALANVRADDGLCRAFSAMVDGPSGALTPTQASKLAGKSRSAFDRQVRTMIGETYGAFIERWRRETAVALLAATDAKITVIAEAVGWSDRTLERACLQNMGSLPRAIRRDVRQRRLLNRRSGASPGESRGDALGGGD